MRRTSLQPAEPHESKIKQPPAGASRRRRPPPRSCSPAPIPRRNDARRDALSGDSRRTLPAGCCSPVRGGRRRAASRQRPHPWPSPLGSNAWERKLDGKLGARARPPRRACSPVPLVRQTTSSV